MRATLSAISARYRSLLLIGISLVPYGLHAQPEHTGLDKFVVHSLDSLNTARNEYAPMVTADGKTIYFVSDRSGGEGLHDIWFATKSRWDDTIFSSPKNLGGPVNSPLAEGAATLTADNQTFYITACNRNDGQGDCDIYEGRIEGGVWKILRPVRELNSPYWEAQPSIGSNGKAIYFVSNRPGAVGGDGDRDIYVSTRGTGGIWTKPRNIGTPINTPKSDEAPYITADGGALYFVSTGHKGLGGSDFFVSKRQTDGSWENPVNLGEPLNTPKDERSIVLLPSGRVVYFASSFKPSSGGSDLDLYMAMIPSQSHTSVRLHGRVYDKGNTAEPETRLIFVDSATGLPVSSTTSSRTTGEYSTVVGIGKSRTIDIYGFREGYGPIQERVTIPDGDKSMEILTNIPSIPAGTSSDVDRGIVISPNPASSGTMIFYSDGNAGAGQKEVRVIADDGNVVMQGSVNDQIYTLNTAPLSNGIYLVRIGVDAAVLVVRK